MQILKIALEKRWLKKILGMEFGVGAGQLLV